MKKSILLIIYSLLVTIFLTSCIKEEEVNLTDETKSYIMQPVGSWWIYEDSLSGAIDTIELINQTLSYDYEDTNIKFEKLFNGFSSSYGQDFGNVTLSDSYSSKHMLVYRPNVVYIQGLELGEESRFGDYTAFFSSYGMNGSVFENVKVFDNLYFWSPNIGLIKKITIDYTLDSNWTPIDTTYHYWKLTKYHINN